MPGYMQPVPMYQTPEHGQKQLTSPLLRSDLDNDGKRSRQQSGKGGSSNVSPSAGVSDSYMLQDIMNELVGGDATRVDHAVDP